MRFMVKRRKKVLDKGEFKKIFDSHFDSLRSFIYFRTSDEQTAEDIAQDVFMRVWEKRESLDTSNIKALLYKMAKDKVVSYYRREGTRLDFAKNMSLKGDAISPQEELQFEETRRRYSEALGEMTEGEREVFLMSREENLKYNEIAERLGLSVKAVEKRMSAALKLLKNKIL